MQFLILSIFMHIFVGCFMLTNPDLFSTISEPGQGMKMPKMAFNPGDQLMASQGDEADKNGTIIPDD
jgi:hypothetical protein